MHKFCFIISLLFTMAAFAETDVAALRKAVQQQGQIAVIVTLDLPAAPPDTALIATTSDSLLQALTPYAVSHIKRYTYLPLLALTVDAAGLEYLLQAPRVRSLTLDIPVAPQLSQ